MLAAGSSASVAPTPPHDPAGEEQLDAERQGVHRQIDGGEEGGLRPPVGEAALGHRRLLEIEERRRHREQSQEQRDVEEIG
jgi:hypothetical protein